MWVKRLVNRLVWEAVSPAAETDALSISVKTTLASFSFVTNLKVKAPVWFQAFLDSHKVSYQSGKVWTTDAPYRETIDKMKRRKEAGAICVDMECSAVAALAAYRGFELCHFFYAADHLSEEKWDIRTLSSHEDLDSKDRIAELAIQFALFWEKAN